MKKNSKYFIANKTTLYRGIKIFELILPFIFFLTIVDVSDLLIESFNELFKVGSLIDNFKVFFFSILNEGTPFLSSFK